ncbi:hypothetical protein BD769DRAFT_1630318 [Suillus cothurnatus]|nr:hypothetical protein BD769DRAFT_1630318 [Suillus cothurnatus]
MTSAPMGRNHRTFNINLIPCPHTGCNHYFKNWSGLTQHHHALHDFLFELPVNAHQCPAESDSNNGEQLLPNVDFHAADHHEDTMDYDYSNDAIDDNMAPGYILTNFWAGHICDAASNFIPVDTIPPPLTLQQPGDWTPYRSQLEFETMEFLYKKVQMSTGDINKLMHLWGLASDLTLWMDATYTTWFRDPHIIIHNMLGNPDIKNKMDYAPYREWKGQGESATRQWRNVMSGDWAWDQADEIAKDPATHGSTFVPVILGSNKTTVLVAMGQNNYYPLYASIRNVHNNVHHAHHNAVAVIGFLAIPKTTKKHSDDPHFQKFKKQLFHSSLSWILSSLKPAMSVPEVVQFGDGHFRRVVYSLGPYIVDYPEQLVLGCVVQNWCTKCFAYPDNLDSSEGGLCLHEVVDTLYDEVDSRVLWEEWGVISDVVPFTNDFPCADIHQLLAPDILHQVIKGAFKDHLMAWVEKYLKKEHGKTRMKVILDDIDHRTSSQGRGFSQWTGNDSKALMKVYLPAIEGHIPQDIHTLCHYSMLICLFGAPNGICSSITESKHIKAVKEPWRRSSKFNVLGQMLLTNQCLDKLAASCLDFTARRMLDDSFILDHLAYLGTSSTFYNKFDNDNDNGTNDHCDGDNNNGEDIQINQADQADSERPHLDEPGDGIIEGPRAHTCPQFEGHIKILNSAAASFYALSDPSSVGGMRHEHIRAAPSWRQGPARNDIVLVNTASKDGINEMDVSHTFLCTLVHWFKFIANEANPDTGMWMLSIIHVDTIICACHLLPIFDSDFAPDNLTLHNILDIWPSFYVNRFIDHHTFEIAY